MCESDDLAGFARRDTGLTRRKFGLAVLGAGLAAGMPVLSLAAETKGKDVDIKTPAGTADAYFVHPAKGKHPGVLIWPDIFGLRPAFKEMATRLAASGYAVLVVNPFYRTQRAPTAPEHADFNNPATRDALMALRASLSADTAQIDAKAFAAFLDQQSAVDIKRKIGTTGYCMGGPLVLQTAAALPGRIGAGATFHGGGLATDKPDSPHLLIPSMKAQFLIAIAENDDAKEPTAKDTLRTAFAQAKLPAEIEVYAGTKHGWCPTDSPAYDYDQAEKAWDRMLALFGRAL
ncbi:MAG: putative hydrolase [Hydrocarboniphaga sp.]|uniref:dienelactone hydrolase family protein n=1 Tax=Hydrocarboniphaga sp. TaxID=2033016 RepID=UPI0026370358|nr:dienelactone hydrolase family protein [Hydrocarboniphaga sp.]MDB5968022.1 putative hydrolase [Hydrocarboniphaga sp.]